MNNSLSLIFSAFTFVLFSIILLVYNATIFFIFLGGSALYVVWVLLFLQVRKRLDGSILNYSHATKVIG